MNLDFTGSFIVFVCFINIEGMKLRQPFKNPKPANKAPAFLKVLSSRNEVPFSNFLSAFLAMRVSCLLAATWQGVNGAVTVVGQG